MAGPLASAVRSKFPGAYDDVPDAELEAAIKAKFPGSYDDVEDITPVSSHEPDDFSKYGPLSQLMRDQAHPAETGAKFREALPTVAAGVATAMAPESLLLRPVVAGGAGFAGSMARGDSMGDAAMEGLTQGGIELAGGALGKGLAAGAERVYSGLLKPAKALRESFPNVVKTALRERAPISNAGVGKITDRMAKSRQAALGMVSTAEAGGAPGVTGKQAMSEFGDVVTELRKRADIGQPNELGRVGQRGRALLRTANKGPNVDIPLTRAQELKETAQEAASGAYRQLERGGSKQLSADDLLDKATATGLRKGIESRVPGVGAQNARTQELLGVTRALEDATGREANNLGIGGMRDLIAAGVGGAAGGLPGAAGGALLMRGLATPAVGSRMAIGANEIAKLPIAQLMRLAQIAALQDEQ